MLLSINIYKVPFIVEGLMIVVECSEQKAKASDPRFTLLRSQGLTLDILRKVLVH